MQKAMFIRKPSNIEEVIHSEYNSSKAEPYQVVETMVIANILYDHFTNNLLKDNPWFAGGKGGQKNNVSQVIEIRSPNRKTLLVNPEGYENARYVAAI